MAANKRYKKHHLTEEQKKVVEKNIPLVSWCLKKMIERGFVRRDDIDDCKSSMYLELCASSSKFDPSRNVKFGSYAANNLFKVSNTYLKKNLEYNQHFVVTDFWCSGEKDDFYTDVEFVQDEYHPTVDWKNVEMFLDFMNISENSKKVLYYRFGKGYTLERVSRILKLTRERIRQIEEKCISKIKHYFNRYNIKREDIITR